MVGIGRTGVGTALSVDGNLRVGIGTLTPDTKLEVTGSTNSDLFSLEGAGSSFKLIGESGDATSINSMAYRLGLRYGSNDNGFIDFYRGPDGATGYLAFGASGSEVMRLDRYGSLGIGTSSPATKMHIQGSAISGSSSDANSLLTLTNNANNSIQINSSSSSAGQIRFGHNSSNYRGAMTYYHSSNILGFTTSGTERVRIDTTGAKFSENFGSTDDVLHINPDNGGNRTMTINGEKINVTYTNSGGAGPALVLQDNGGSVGIGTSSPGNKFTINSTSANQASIQYDSATRLQISVVGSGVSTFLTDNNASCSFTNGVLIGGSSASGHDFNFEVLNDHAYVKGPDGWNGNGDKAIVALGSGVSNESFGCGYVYGTGLVLSTYKPSGGGHFGSSTQNSLIIADTTGEASFINDVVAFASSDKRLKENVKPLDNALHKINKINGVEFDWIDGKDEYGNSVHSNTGHDVGVIAQEIEEVLPEVVTTRDNGYKAVKYEKIVPLLIEAIKEQQQQINKLEEKLNG